MTEPDESSPQPRDAGVSGLYRSAADDAPSAAMDAAILKAARAAVASKLAPVQPWWKRLVVPAGVAATALFAVMLTLTMERNPPVEAEVSLQKGGGAPAPTVPASPAAFPATNVRTDQAAVREAPPAASLPPVAPAEKKMKAAEAVPLARDAAMPAASAPSPAMAPVLPEGRLAAPAAKAEHQESSEAASSDRARASSAAPSLESAAKRAAPRSESMWLEEIRQLRRQGKHEEAARRLAEFRAAYPDYVLPDDMK